MPRAKDIRAVRSMGGNKWQVTYKAANGRYYWKLVTAADELEAYTKVLVGRHPNATAS